MADWTRICCAVDFSDTSQLAMSRAADLARRYGAELAMVHVVTPSRGGVAGPSPEELARRETERAEHQLSRWRSGAEFLAGKPVRTAVLLGDPAAEIVRHAREGGFDLLVLGTHGRTGLRRLVLGSVAEKVLRHAACPVLAVRPMELKLEDRRAEDELARIA